ncbi:hypothetical protein [Streptomyces sp. NPDC000410]|uniref:hypothetical protein n=1 Tax=Streptomyces sp. NPDC000410 TaxID=3154254 RepID=UPI00332FCF87
MSDAPIRPDSRMPSGRRRGPAEQEDRERMPPVPQRRAAHATGGGPVRNGEAPAAERRLT